MMGMSEVNVAWHHVNFHERLGSRTSEWFESWHVTTAWNQHESFPSATQIGGIALLTVGKLTYQVTSAGSDPTGLGHWTWTWLRSKNWASHLHCHLLLSHQK